MCPDYWCIIKVSGNDPHYRVFATWTGSYLTGSAWRMNSGITKAVDLGDRYEFHGESGSIYYCLKNSYGCYWESQAELNRLLSHDSGSFTLLPAGDNWDEIDYIIK